MTSRRAEPAAAAHKTDIHPARTTRDTDDDASRADASADATDFAVLGLSPVLARAVADEGYTRPTPIQSRAIPHALLGRDLVACAQTGTGKTAAFVLPVLQRLAAQPRTGKIRALVVTPTRELAAQIGERVTAYGRHGGLKHIVIYGGVGQRPQEDALRGRPDIVIATPGRLLDLMQQRFVDLSGVNTLVLDEADRMLDMGFLPDVKRIIAAVPTERQTLLFSATMPAPIAELAKGVLRDAVRVSVTPQATAAETVSQSVYFVGKTEKRHLLERLLRTSGVERAIVFTRTKHGANRVAEQLTKGGIEALAIHGNKSQGARERALESFRLGTTPVLVATDLAARGIDVEGVSHVFNFDLPNVAEQYVHRIGRTGRAGARGMAVAFCDPAEERGMLADIEKLLRARIPVAPGSPSMHEVQPAAGEAEVDGRGTAPTQRRGGGRSQAHPRGQAQRPGEGRPSQGQQRPAQAHGQAQPRGASTNVASSAGAEPSSGAPRRRRPRRRYRGVKVS